jgi:rubrerythrin
MAVRFSADDALALAVKIEENGSRFYRAAAEKVKEQDAVDLLKRLADWELTHQQKFAAIKVKLSEKERQPTAYDPDNEAELFLAALADRTVFDTKEDPLAALGARPGLKHILEEGIRREKESIVFYVGLREVVPAKLGGDKVDGIIKEELSHIVALNQTLAKIK